MGNLATSCLHEPTIQPWSARIQAFQSFTMAHPHLISAKDQLMNAIHEVPPNSLILVLGPTGVGKTTLRTKIEQLLASELLPTLQDDRGRFPVVSVECIAPESGCFNWRDHFRRLLIQMEELWLSQTPYAGKLPVHARPSWFGSKQQEWVGPGFVSLLESIVWLECENEVEILQ